MCPRTLQLLSLVLLTTGGQALLAADGDVTGQPPSTAIRETSPGIYQIGKIRLNRKAASVEFPVEINPVEGLLEYALVTPEGSAHESLLKTSISPSDLHAAMLLLGVRPSLANGAPGNDGPAAAASATGRLTNDALKTAPKLSGASVTLRLSWTDEGREHSVPLEDWILNTQTGTAMARGTWIYNGSLMVGTTFAAQADGNLIALVTDPGALLNNPRSGNDNDQVWGINTCTVPAPGKVTGLTLKIEVTPQTSPKP